MNKTTAKINGSEQAWETGELGQTAAHAIVSQDVSDTQLNLALQLQPISIRLQKSLIDDLKTIAELNGIGYQPLMRQALTRFVQAEMKRIANEALAEQRQLNQSTRPRKTA
ncbi:MAG: CopG family antitoxin [Aeromonas sp.]